MWEQGSAHPQRPVRGRNFAFFRVVYCFRLNLSIYIRKYRFICFIVVDHVCGWKFVRLGGGAPFSAHRIWFWVGSHLAHLAHGPAVCISFWRIRVLIKLIRCFLQNRPVEIWLIWFTFGAFGAWPAVCISFWRIRVASFVYCEAFLIPVIYTSKVSIEPFSWHFMLFGMIFSIRDTIKQEAGKCRLFR